VELMVPVTATVDPASATEPVAEPIVAESSVPDAPAAETAPGADAGTVRAHADSKGRS